MRTQLKSCQCTELITTPCIRMDGWCRWVFSCNIQLHYPSVVRRFGGLQSHRGRGGNENIFFFTGRTRTPVIQLVASPTILSEVLVLYLVCWQDLHYYRRLKNWSFSRTVFRLTAKLYIIFFWRDSPQWTMASSFTRFLDHTQRRTTFGRTPLDEWSARRRDLYLTTHKT